MFSFNLIKFFGVFAVVLFISSACRFWQKPAGENPAPAPYVAEELVSEIPFSTKDPEVFQAEIVTTAGGSEKVVFAARNGARRRFDFPHGASRISVIETDKNYLLVNSRKIYAENPAQTIATPGDEWSEMLTTEWLSARQSAKFFKLEAENNLTRYRVTFNEAGAAQSESLIYIDDAAGILVKQEFYSLADGQRTLTMTIELKNLKLEAADELFAVPKDFKKVSADELRAILKKGTE
jgi:hypothetical protein